MERPTDTRLLISGIGGLLLTTESVVSEKPEKKGAGAGMPDMSGMGDMDF